MKPFSLIAAVLVCLTIFSCAALRDIDFSVIRIGMSKNEVINLIGKPQRVVGAQKYDDGILEIYEYKVNKLTTEEADGRYNWLFFLNNELQEFGDKNQYIPNEYDRYYNKYRRNRR